MYLHTHPVTNLYLTPVFFSLQKSGNTNTQSQKVKHLFDSFATLHTGYLQWTTTGPASGGVEALTRRRKASRPVAW